MCVICYIHKTYTKEVLDAVKVHWYVVVELTKSAGKSVTSSVSCQLSGIE